MLSATDYRRCRSELVRRSLRLFIVEAWPHIVGGVYVPSWHVDAIADHLQALQRGEIESLLINVPPRHLKSTLAGVMWPAWCWLQDPGLRFLIGSYEQGLAIRDAKNARRLMRTDWYRAINTKPTTSEPLFRLAGDPGAVKMDLKDTGDWYENDRGGSRIAVGVKGSATGKGGHIVGFDDPHNPTQALSDAMRSDAIEWWDRTMSTRQDDPKTPRTFGIMQRLHQSDLSARMLELGCVHLFIPAEFDPRRICTTVLGFADPRTEEGELICPARFGRAEIDKLKRALNSPAAIAGQLAQSPIPEGGVIFERDWLRTYAVKPPRFDVVIDSWDCAFKAEDDSSYVVGQKWGRIGADMYLLEQTREHMDLPSTCMAVLAMANKYPRSSAKIIEGKANGPAVMQSLRRKLPGMIEVEPEGGKIVRARAVTAFFKSGNVFVPEQSEWLFDYLNELAAFPRAPHDDQVDATTQAITYLCLGDEVSEDEAADELRAMAGHRSAAG